MRFSEVSLSNSSLTPSLVMIVDNTTIYSDERICKRKKTSGYSHGTHTKVNSMVIDTDIGLTEKLQEYVIISNIWLLLV